MGSGQCYSAKHAPRASRRGPGDAGGTSGRPPSRPRRQIHLASLRDAGGAGRRPSRRSAATSTGADCLATLDCLRVLGVAIQRHAGRRRRDRRPRPARADGARSAARRRQLGHDDAAAVGNRRRARVSDGDGRRRVAQPPADARVIDPLTVMGARIASQDGRPPLTIDGGGLRGITHQPEVPSAQVKSAVLLAGLQAEGETTRLEPVATRDHTERAFHAFGVRVQTTGDGHQRRRRTASRRAGPRRCPATSRARRSGSPWRRARRAPTSRSTASA